MAELANLANARPTGPGMTTMIGEEEVVDVHFPTHRDERVYVYDHDKADRIKLRLSVKHHSLNIMHRQGACIFLNRLNAALSQLLHLPAANQIEARFDLVGELASLGTTDTALPRSICAVKIVVRADSAVAAAILVSSFQAAFGDEAAQTDFRAVWEHSRAALTQEPNDEQARLDFMRAYALLHGSDKEARDRIGQPGRSRIGSLPTIEEEAEEEDNEDGGVKLPG